MATLGEFERDAKGRPKSAAEVVTTAGTRIYLLPVETFPGHHNNLYLVDHPDHPLLFDAGSGRPESWRELELRFDEIATRFGVRTRLRDLAEAVISHAHMDHFGGARQLRELSVPIAIHELDARVLEGFHERILLASRDLALFLRQSGLGPEQVGRLMDLYRGGKGLFSDLEPDRRLYQGDRIGPGWPILHVPGHCPGMICLAVDDVVLTADHLLARITPIQSPQAITPFMGLENYLRSLEKLLAFGDFDLGLGAHEAPIPDVPGRTVETARHHEDRLKRVFELSETEPRTIAGLSRNLFGRQRGYGVLLALWETAAHVELLHELGYLTIENLEEVSRDLTVAPAYRARSRSLHPVFRRSRLLGDRHATRTPPS